MRILSWFLVLSLLWTAPVIGHGARIAVIDGGVAVEAVFDNGSPMAFCDVTVFAPDEGDEAFQIGTTDENGRFAFVPDTLGTWRVMVDDGMGHVASTETVVDSEMVRRDAGRQPVGRIAGGIVGVGVIFGLFGLLSLFYRSFKRGR